MPIIILLLLIIGCAEKKAKKPEIWAKKVYHVDTILRPEMVLADMNISRIYADTVYELWINTETGSTPFHYLDKNKNDFTDNIMVMPDSKKVKK